MKKKGLIIGGVVIFLLLVSGGSCVSRYNGLVTTDESVDTAWSQVENVLQRRNDLIPNLVNTVKGYATHERELFEQFAKARQAAAGAKTVNEKIAANQAIGGLLSRLMLVVERYPDLKANQNFLALQDELSGTENRIAVERRRYNEAVKVYNVLTRRFPTNIMASILNFEKRDYFEAEEAAKEVPEVKFN